MLVVYHSQILGEVYVKSHMGGYFLADLGGDLDFCVECCLKTVLGICTLEVDR